LQISQSWILGAARLARLAVALAKRAGEAGAPDIIYRNEGTGRNNEGTEHRNIIYQV